MGTKRVRVHAQNAETSATVDEKLNEMAKAIAQLSRGLDDLEKKLLLEFATLKRSSPPQP